jgi:hypothetical protein
MGYFLALLAVFAVLALWSIANSLDDISDSLDDLAHGDDDI